MQGVQGLMSSEAHESEGMTVLRVHVIIHLPKLIECTPPRVNCNVLCGLRVIMICNVGSSIVSDASL